MQYISTVIKIISLQKSTSLASRVQRDLYEQLLMDAVILGQAKNKRRGLYMGYIDYCEAFDSVPHAWLLHVLEIYKV